MRNPGGGSFNFTGTNSLNLGTGTVTLLASPTVTVTAGTLTVGGTITDGVSTFGLTKAGAGTLTLNGAGTYDGGVTLNAGTLNINNASALGTGTLTVAGGTIDNTSGGAIVLSNNNAQIWNGDFTFGGSNNLNLGSGGVTLNNSLVVTTNGSGVLTVNGIITDGASSYGLTKAGGGTLTLGGANTFDGGVTLSAGTLNLNHATALGTGALALNGGTLDNITGGAVTLTANNLQTWGGNFAFTGSNNLNLGAGAVTLTGNRTVTVNGGTLAVDGAIGDGGNGYGVTKEGAGTLSFGGSGSNTYTGTTAANTGLLALAKTGGATAVAGNLTIGASGTVRLDASHQIADTSAVAFSASGTPVLNLNGYSERIGSLASANSGAQVQLGTPGAATTFTAGDANNTTYAGTFTSGNANPTLVKEGSGSLTLSGTSTGFTGATTINTGTLIAASASALGSGAAGTTVTSGATLALQGSGNMTSAPLSLNGTGVGGGGALLNISGTNTWNGDITLAGNTTITSNASGSFLRLGVTPTSFTPSGTNLPTESGVVVIGNKTLTFNGTGNIIVNDRITDFIGQKAHTLYTDAVTVLHAPETTSPGNVIIDMSGGANVRFRANANSYTGTTTVNNGTLIVDTVTNSGAPHDPVTYQFHGINGPLVIGNGDGTAAAVQLGTGGAANEVLAIGTTVNIFRDGTLNINNQAQTIDALTFTGGAVTVGSGTLFLNNNVTVNASAGNTASISGSGFLSLSLHRDAVADPVGTYPDATRSFTVAHGTGNVYDLTIGAVVQNGSLVKAGDGVMMMNAINTYVGTTSVNGGILNIQSGTDGTNSSGLGSGNGTDGQGTTVASGATLQLQGGIGVTTEKLNLSGNGYDPGTGVLGAFNSLSGNNTWGAGLGTTLINLNNDARINASGGNLTIATNVGSSSNNALSFGVASGSTITVSGSIATGSGSTTTLTKDGAGTLVLTGSNAYQGATNITAGVLSAQNDFALGATTTGSNGTFVSSGAELQLSNVTNGNRTIAGEALSINGAGVGGTTGALHNVAGNNSFGGVVTVASTSTIYSAANTLTLSGGTSSANQALTVAGPGNITVSGGMSNGSGELTKTGSGTFTFSGTTGTVGATHLNQGTISVATGSTLNTGALDSATSTTLLIASGGTVSSTYGTGTTTYFSGVMDGAGTFEKKGAGNLVFNHSTGFDASGLTLVLAGGTVTFTDTNAGSLAWNDPIDPAGTSRFQFGTIHITGNTILDFNNSAGTFLSSAYLVIDAGVTVTVNNWISVANNTSLSTVWYATNTVNAGSLGGSDLLGGNPLERIAFTNYNGLTTTWVSGNHNGWFDHEIRPTPEPSTYGALFLLGCFGFFGWRRWRDKRSSETKQS